ncbi:MAG: mechanosensitive ion channel family protein [Ktedonobacteraceae bacterium]
MIQSTINSLTNSLGTIITFIPRFIGFLVILLIGWFISVAAGKAVTMLLRKVGFERLSQRVGLTQMEQRMGIKMDTAGVLGKITFWFLFLIFLVPATDSLGLPTISSMLDTIVAYLPNVFVAVLVLFLGTLLAVFAGDLVRGGSSAAKVGNPRILGEVARWSVIGFAAMVALEQLQIAPALINVLFSAIVASLALAFGLAFGLGGRETAQRWLARNESQMLGNRPYNPEHIMHQAQTDLTHSEQMGQQSRGSQPPPPTYSPQQNVPPPPRGHEPPPSWPTRPRSEQP